MLINYQNFQAYRRHLTKKQLHIETLSRQREKYNHTPRYNARMAYQAMEHHFDA